MSSIHGKASGPHLPSSLEEEVAPHTPPLTPPGTPRPGPRAAANALGAEASRPPMAAHTQSESVLRRSPQSPAPASPPARHTKTTPTMGGAQQSAEADRKQERVASLAATRVAYATLDDAGHALATRLAELTHHAQGLKAYFFAAPGLPALLAGHALADVEAFAEQRAQAGGGGAAAAGAARQSKVASHDELNRVLFLPAAKRKPGPGEPSPREVSKVLMRAGMQGGKLPQPLVAGGERPVQGGTRLCRPAGHAHAVLQPSGQYGYLDGGPEVTEALANFYANALLAEAAATHGGGAPPRVQPDLQKEDFGELPQAEMNRGLTTLADAINARLDALVPRG